MSYEPSKFNLKQIKGLNVDSTLDITLTKTINQVIESYKKNLKSTSIDYAQIYGYDKVVVDDFFDQTEFSLFGGATYDHENKYVYGSGTVISSYEHFTSVTKAMLIPCEILGTGTIMYEISRNNGISYNSISKFSDFDTFNHTGNIVKIKATISGDAKLLGWSYLIKE